MCVVCTLRVMFVCGLYVERCLCVVCMLRVMFVCGLYVVGDVCVVCMSMVMFLCLNNGVVRVVRCSLFVGFDSSIL